MPVNPLTELTEGLPIERVRGYAWVGDAMLALFMRAKILEKCGQIDTQRFVSVTSNQFLSSFGSPTRVEAQIGILREREGEAAAMSYSEREIWPRAQKQL